MKTSLRIQLGTLALLCSAFIVSANFIGLEVYDKALPCITLAASIGYTLARINVSPRSEE